MTTRATLLTHRPLLAIGLMLVAGSLLPVMNGFGKYLASLYPPEQVIWARLLTHMLWMLAIFLPRSGRALFRTRSGRASAAPRVPCTQWSGHRV